MTTEEWKKLLYANAIKVSKANTPEEIRAATAAAQQVEKLGRLAGIDVDSVQTEDPQPDPTPEPPEAPQDTASLPQRRRKQLARINHDLNRMRAIELLSRGIPPSSIAEQIGVGEYKVRRYLADAQNSMIRYLSEPRITHTFARHAAFTLGIIGKLQETYEKVTTEQTDKRHWTAAVSSLRAQADLMNQLLDRGLQLGIIDQRKPTEALNRNHPDLREALRLLANQATTLLTKVEDDQGLPARRIYRKTGQHKTYSRKIRKVKRDKFGTVRTIKDWKYLPKVKISRDMAKEEELGIQEMKYTEPSEPIVQINLKQEINQIQNILRRERPMSKVNVIDVTAERLPDTDQPNRSDTESE